MTLTVGRCFIDTYSYIYSLLNVNEYDGNVGRLGSPMLYQVPHRDYVHHGSQIYDIEMTICYESKF